MIYATSIPNLEAGDGIPSSQIGIRSSEVAAKSAFPVAIVGGVLHTQADHLFESQNLATDSSGELVGAMTHTGPEGWVLLQDPPLTIRAGDTLTVAFNGATDERTINPWHSGLRTESANWVGMFPEGSTPDQDAPFSEGFGGLWDTSYEWNAHVAVSGGSGTVQVTPLKPGRYFLVLMCCTGYLEISDRIPVEVEPACGLMNTGPRVFDASNFWSVYNGTLDQASAISEYLQLMYMNGMDTSVVAPGITERDIGKFIRLHTLNVRTSSGSAAVASSFGSPLLAHLTATMQTLITGESVAGIHARHTDRLVFYAGHDINIYYLRELLNLNWLTESYAINEAPFGGMLRFELGHQAGDNETFVRVRSTYPTDPYASLGCSTDMMAAMLCVCRCSSKPSP